MKNPITRTIPLANHEAIIAALQLCDMIGNDNVAVVMMRGVSGDLDNFTGVYLADYDMAEIWDDDSWFSDYEDPQLWVSTEGGGL